MAEHVGQAERVCREGVLVMRTVLVRSGLDEGGEGLLGEGVEGGIAVVASLKQIGVLAASRSERLAGDGVILPVWDRVRGGCVGVGLCHQIVLLHRSFGLGGWGVTSRWRQAGDGDGTQRVVGDLWPDGSDLDNEIPGCTDDDDPDEET